MSGLHESALIAASNQIKYTARDGVMATVNATLSLASRYERWFSDQEKGGASIPHLPATTSIYATALFVSSNQVIYNATGTGTDGTVETTADLAHHYLQWLSEQEKKKKHLEACAETPSQSAD